MPLPAQDFELGEKEFRYIATLIRKEAGIVIGEQKRALVYSRISRRLRELGMTSFQDYAGLLQDPKRAHSEMEQFINALTTNLTSFFRESHHFDYLRDTVLPELVRTKKDKEIRIWSAGCSSGEEPYSIAITALESMPRSWTVRIQASELDTNILDIARRGIYPMERVEKLPDVTRRRWFRRGTGGNAGLVRVSPQLQEVITFQQLNLLHNWSFPQRFDIIFCRNVVIYFDKETQVTLFEKYANQLVEHGHLFIGHSESLFQKTSRFKLIGKTVYQKTS